MNAWLRQLRKRSVAASLPKFVDTPRPPIILSYAVLAGLAIIGVLLAVGETRVTNEVGKSVLQHTASAFIVAAVIGLSYERLLHKHRVAETHRLLADHGEKTLNAINAMWNLLPAHMFALLGNVVSENYKYSNKIPTLYSPAREEREYTFASSITYFDAIADVARKDLIRVLTQWILPGSNPGLKFLASDFVGRYRITELQDQLWQIYQTQAAKWETLTADEKACALNYLWAASRCERRMYTRLAGALKVTGDEFVRDWILFVPHQMQDGALCNVISEYLARADVNSDEEMIPAIRALAQLYGAERKRVVRVIAKHAHKLDSDVLVSEIKRFIADLVAACRGRRP